MKPWLMLLVLSAACGGPSADLGPDAGAYGGYCDRLKTHVVDDIDVVFGCPVPPVL